MKVTLWVPWRKSHSVVTTIDKESPGTTVGFEGQPTRQNLTDLLVPDSLTHPERTVVLFGPHSTWLNHMEQWGSLQFSLLNLELRTQWSFQKYFTLQVLSYSTVHSLWLHSQSAGCPDGKVRLNFAFFPHYSGKAMGNLSRGHKWVQNQCPRKKKIVTIDAGKDWRQEKGMTEDEMVGWHHRLNMDMSLSKLHELVMDRKPGVLQSMGLQRVGHNWATELNSNF